MTIVYDIETSINLFCLTGLNIETQEVEQFTIWEEYDGGLIDNAEMVALRLYLSKCKGMISFNGLGFDYPIIHYFLQNYNKLSESNKICAEALYSKAQELISQPDNFMLRIPDYKALIPQLDLYKIHHFDNSARRSSLKWCEYGLDLDIEEMPIHHSTRIETIEQISSILEYNKQDVLATYELYKLTKGDTNHPCHKGIDKIQLRKDIIAEFGINCINYNDVKIGDELNKLNYCKIKGIQRKDLPKPSVDIPKFKFKDCFPSYYKFQTIEFTNFINSFGNVEVDLKKKQEFEFTYNGTTYLIAKGGCHSKDKPRFVNPSVNEILRDQDVQSMYPNAIAKRNLFPRHLGKEWNTAYVSNIQKRVDAKKKFKETKDPKYDNIQSAFKLVLNGNFGKLNEESNWQYDPLTAMQVTIGSQIDLLMLIEDLEVAGIHVISANTDGLVTLFNESLNDIYYKVSNDWEIEVGNDKLGKLEYVDYKALIQTSVNDYIAIKHNNKFKCKGHFVSDFELYKNKSKKIVPIALQNYYLYNIPIEKTIKEHTNIFDFCLAVKGKGDGKFIAINKQLGSESELQKINRYYLSNSGINFVKRLKPLEGKKVSKQIDIFGNVDDGTRELEVEAGWLSTIYNKHEIDKDILLYDINFDYYISQAKRIIEQIK